MLHIRLILKLTVVSNISTPWILPCFLFYLRNDQSPLWLVTLFLLYIVSLCGQRTTYQFKYPIDLNAKDYFSEIAMCLSKFQGYINSRILCSSLLPFHTDQRRLRALFSGHWQDYNIVYCWARKDAKGIRTLSEIQWASKIPFWTPWVLLMWVGLKLRLSIIFTNISLLVIRSYKSVNNRGDFYLRKRSMHVCLWGRES